MFALSLSGASIAPADTSLPLLEDVELTVRTGERLALIGPNGSGKSTLLAALAGRIDLLAGARAQHGAMSVAYADRALADDPDTSIEVALLEQRPDDRRVLVSLRDAQNEPLLDGGMALAAAIDAWDERGGWELEAQMARALDGLGIALAGISLADPVAHLSGGQRQRVRLAALLLADADVILLDEPTDDLDVEASAWLERQLLASDRALVLASHDRSLLERWPVRIAEIDAHAKRLVIGSGPIDVFERARDRRALSAQRDFDAAERRHAAAERAAAARAAKAMTMTRARVVGDRFDPNLKAWYNERAGGLARSARVLRERDERQRVERPHRPTEVGAVRVAPVDTDRGSGVAVHLDQLEIGYGTHVVAGPLDATVERGERLALTGRNGAGKTTLLRTIAGELTPLDGGVRLGSTTLAVLEQRIPAELLDLAALEVIGVRVAEEHRARAATVLGTLLVRGADLQRPVRELSEGSRRKVLIACLLASGSDVLLLDEPANHLDLASRDALAFALESSPTTLVFTSHDRTLLERIATRELAVG